MFQGDNCPSFDELQSRWEQYLRKSQATNTGVERQPQRQSMKDVLDGSFRHEDGSMTITDMMMISERLHEVFGRKTLNEEKTPADIARAQANSPNPVQASSIGPDSQIGPTPNFTDGKALRRLAELKMELDHIERDLRVAEVEKDTSAENGLKVQLDKLRKQIEEINNLLTPKD